MERRNFFSQFHVGATFEMRTTLCEIHLLNDPMTTFKCGTKSCGERAGQQRDRKRESVRDKSIAENERWRGQ